MMTRDDTDESRGRGEGRGRGHGGRGGGRGGERGGPEGRGRRGGWQVADLPPADDAADWFRGRLPEGWFSEVEVRTDREEITVMGTLSDEQAEGADGAAAEGRIGRFRSETKAERIEIALEAQARYQRKVSWGVRLGGTEALFTHVAAPVMTRLRQPERQVLDTLVAAGVARSRADALVWCVRLVGQHESDWIARMSDALSAVHEARDSGPDVASD